MDKLSINIYMYLILLTCMSRNLGAQALLLGPNELANRFPWLETKELALGCLGIQNEGWFDPWLLLNSFKKKVVSLGVPYLHGTVESVQVAEKHVKAVKVCQLLCLCCIMFSFSTSVVSLSVHLPGSVSLSASMFVSGEILSVSVLDTITSDIHIF